MWLKSVILPVGTNADSLSGTYVKHRGSADESQEFLPALGCCAPVWALASIPVHHSCACGLPSSSSIAQQGMGPPALG